MPDTMTRPWFCPRDETCPSGTHDTYSGYRRGCRSGAATEGRRLYNKRWREGRNPPRLVSPVGVARRIQACDAVGHTGGELAAALGVTRGRIAELRTSKYPRMNVALPERIVPILDRLAMRPPPWSPVRLKHLSWARRQGFVPLLAWDDIDDPAEQPPPLVEAAPRERPHPMSRKLTLVEIDSHLLESVLHPKSATKFADLSVAEQDHILERLWRDAVGQGYEYPGRRVAEQLEVSYREVETVRSRVTSRRIRERKVS